MDISFFKNGYHDKPVELDSKNIPALAKFICEDPNRDKMITDTADNAVISTFGCFFLIELTKETIDFPALLNELQKFNWKVHWDMRKLRMITKWIKCVLDIEKRLKCAILWMRNKSCSPHGVWCFSAGSDMET